MGFRIGIIDDNELWRTSLRNSLQDRGLEVTICSERVDAFMEQVRADPPNVVIVDLRMPPSLTDQGIRVAEQLREEFPDLGIIIMSGYEEDLRHHYARRAAQKIPRGPLGFLYKDRVTPVSLYADICRVAQGRSVVDADIAIEVVESLRSEQAGVAAFSDIELRILNFMVAGWTNKSISTEIRLSIPVIERHISEIFRKLIPDEKDPGSERNKRVLAVVTWLNRTGRPANG
ncbi:response regulator transcription factor [Planomonospora sp. ID91781]|uniref:response regulator transcription factor n=1 Tax=Planomonospora sp. ID91781 TaxID=2738135 RepID=UPI0018C3E10C|nr:response regulator transcription factor [Planomonospora sp. ID91781]MBG0825928.1 response regulator transcription factor [Planomonospora sp. ID91781]